MSVRTINYISNILLTIVNFTVNFYLASVIGLESYGNYVVQLSVTSLSVSLIFINFTNLIIKKKQERIAKQLYIKLVQVNMVIWFILTLILLLSVVMFTFWIDTFDLLFSILLVYSWIQITNVQIISFLASQNKLQHVTISYLSEMICKVIALAIIFWSVDNVPTLLIYTSILLFNQFGLLIYLQKRIYLGQFMSIYPEASAIRFLTISDLKYVLQSHFNQILKRFTQMGDIVIAQIFFSPSTIGVYDLLKRVSSPLNIITNPLANLYFKQLNELALKRYFFLCFVFKKSLFLIPTTILYVVLILLISEMKVLDILSDVSSLAFTLVILGTLARSLLWWNRSINIMIGPSVGIKATIITGFTMLITQMATSSFEIDYSLPLAYFMTFFVAFLYWVGAIIFVRGRDSMYG